MNYKINQGPEVEAVLDLQLRLLRVCFERAAYENEALPSVPAGHDSVAVQRVEDAGWETIAASCVNAAHAAVRGWHEDLVVQSPDPQVLTAFGLLCEWAEADAWEPGRLASATSNFRWARDRPSSFMSAVAVYAARSLMTLAHDHSLAEDDESSTILGWAFNEIDGAL